MPKAGFFLISYCRCVPHADREEEKNASGFFALLQPAFFVTEQSDPRTPKDSSSAYVEKTPMGSSSAVSFVKVSHGWEHVWRPVEDLHWSHV
jgi:hypothetical protein